MLAVFALLLAGLIGYGLWLAQSTPVERHLRIGVPNWPANRPPLRMVLATDLHVSNLGRSRDRIERVIAQIEALKPDVILLGGDYVGGGVQDHPERIAPALAPLGALKAPLGVFAVMGNHDRHTDGAAIIDALHKAKIRVLLNSAASAGPLVIGGIDDEFSHRAKLLPTAASMSRREGVSVLLAHSPDVFPLENLQPVPMQLTLAGHTHCGQIALPWYGAIIVPVHFKQYKCGVYWDRGRALVVSGGIGTSQIPIRLFAPPDLWVIEIGAAAKQ